MRAKFRKHQVALLTLLVANAIVFYPVLFMGRVVSPNDVYNNFFPWRSVHAGPVQNTLIHDPPTAYLPLFSLLKSGGETFHWNPYIASGIPGFGSAASAVLSPLIALPVLLAPLVWSYTLILVLKLNLAFFFAYGWLREERLGKAAAAIGAIVAAAAGPIALRWLWQSTNATVFYAALLWVICRWFNSKRVPWSLLPLLGVSYLLSGFPAAIAYGSYLALAYFAYRLIFQRRFSLRTFGGAVLAIVISMAIAAPSLVPFIGLIRRSGYLDLRAEASRQTFFPPWQFRGFVDAEHLGNPALKNWRGDASLALLNNYVEANLYFGVLAIVLALLGLFRRQARHRLFFAILAAAIIAAMFGAPVISRILGGLPGLKYSSLARLTLLLPIPLAYLAAAGVGQSVASLRRFRPAVARAVALLLGVVLASDLAVTAARFHSYLPPDRAAVPSTPTIEFLRGQKGPFRIAPTFDYFWPNASELYRIEDVRSHFSSEKRYRMLLQRIDPTAFSGTTTVIQFNSLKFDFNDPLVSMLGIRYFIEHKAIDIIKWGIFERTKGGSDQRGYLPLRAGGVFERTIVVDELPFWAIELPAAAEGNPPSTARLQVDVRRGEELLTSHAFSAADLRVNNKVYLPLGRNAHAGEVLHLRIAARGMNVGLSRGSAPDGEAPVYFGRVTTPVILERELPDGRLFRNLAEVPRFHTVRHTRRMTDAQFLGDRGIDFHEEAVITDLAAPPQSNSFEPASVDVLHISPARQVVDVVSASDAFLATSEKLTPELRVTIDGEVVRPVEINMLFTGVTVPAGKHRVEFTRRIGRGWWPLAAAAAAIWFAAAMIDLWRVIRRRAVGPPE